MKEILQAIILGGKIDNCSAPKGGAIGFNDGNCYVYLPNIETGSLTIINCGESANNYGGYSGIGGYGTVSTNMPTITATFYTNKGDANNYAILTIKKKSLDDSWIGNNLGELFPCDPDRIGYVFDGWYDNDNLTGKPVNSDTVLEENTTLYAKWTPIPAVAPTITEQPENIDLIFGYTEANINVKAITATDTAYGDLSYQWYSNTENSNTGGTEIKDANAANYVVPTKKNAGTTEYYYCVVTAMRTDNEQKAATTSRAVCITVSKANPEYNVPKDLTAIYGQTLADVILPTGWKWTDRSAKVGNVGINKFKAIFTPNDTTNYNTVTDVNVDVTVGHRITAVERKEPTCTKEGYEHYWIDEQNNMYSDAEGKNQISGPVVIAKKGHTYGQPNWMWNGTENASAIFTCEKDDDTITVNAEITNEITTQPTCSTTGIRTYTATVTFDNKVYTDKVTAVESENGHDWGVPTYEWILENGAWKCTAKRICVKDETHIDEETVTATEEVTLPATCTEKGETTYNAFFTNTAFVQQTKVETNIEATGHYWNKPVYSWADDNSMVKAVRTCKNDSSHKEQEEVSTTYKVVNEPAFDHSGLGRYTSNKYENKAFTVQTKDIVIPAKLCTVTFDSNGGTKVESQQISFMDLAQKPENPTKENFEFIGWYLGDIQYDFGTPVQGEITLNAKWTNRVDNSETDTTMSTETDTDSVTESDTESETDTKTNSDTESETDTKTNSDTESETDTKTNNDTETETDTKTNSDTESETDTKTNSDTESETDTKTNSDTESETDTKTNSDTESETDTKTNSDTESETDTINTETDDTPNTPDTPDIPSEDDNILYGDVNGDGKITAKDSLMTQRYAIKLATLTADQLKAADVDKDNKVTTKDALYILRCSINMAILPIEK